MENNLRSVWIPIESIPVEFFEDFGGYVHDIEHLPLLLFPKNAEECQQLDSFEFSFINLLFGVVYGYQEINKRILDQAKTKEHIQRMLRTYFEKSKNQTFELMLLDMSAVVKNELDVLTYKRFLHSCTMLVPEGSQIKRDLIIANWVVMIVKPSMPSLYEKIIDLYNQLDLKLLDELGSKIAMLYCLFSMIKLRKESEEIERFLADKVYPIIDERYFILLIKNLLQNPDKFTVKDLLISSDNVASWGLLREPE